MSQPTPSPSPSSEVSPKGRLGLSSILILLALLILPTLAVIKLQWPLHWVGIYVLGVSLSTVGFYAFDKKRARLGGRRIPEKTLHFLELIGGWPGAWIAQRYLRHKTAKVSYRVVFAIILLAYQGLSLDVLLDGQAHRAVLKQVEQLWQ